MTEIFLNFLNETNLFLNNSDYSNNKYCDFVDDLWCNHNEELEYSDDYDDLEDEDTLMSYAWELVDRFDECNEIVDNDPYCINGKTLRDEINKLYTKITSLDRYKIR